MTSFWVISIVFLSMAAIFVRYKKEQLYKFLKPLPIILLLLFFTSHVGQKPFSLTYTLIGLGLFLGLLGDLLLLRKEFFLPGLISFLIGHVSYVCAFVLFSQSISLATIIATLVVSLLAGSVFAVKLRKKQQQKYIVPVLLYISVITTMVTTAFEVDFIFAFTYPWLFLGAFLFCLSDLTLATNKFLRPFGSAQLIILSTYYSAQALIVFAATSYGF